MMYSKWLLTGTALALCLALSAPCEIQAASSKKETSSIHKSSSKDGKSVSAKKPAAGHSEKSVSSKKSNKDRLAGKSEKPARKRSDGKKAMVSKNQDRSGKAKKSDKYSPHSKDTVAERESGSDKHKKDDLKKDGLQGVSKKVASKNDTSRKGAQNRDEVKSASLARKDAKGKKPADDREIWLERARESEVLGKASWYGKDFHNKATASGLDYDMHTFTAAHRTLPMGTVVKVTDQKKGKSVMVCVTDRGPFVRGRIIDLSYAAARKLDLDKRGVCRVKLEVVSDEKGAPLKPDQAYFVRFGNRGHKDKVGPFKGFADAAAMHEALRQAHPDAEVVLDSMR